MRWTAERIWHRDDGREVEAERRLHARTKLAQPQPPVSLTLDPTASVASRDAKWVPSIG